MSDTAIVLRKPDLDNLALVGEMIEASGLFPDIKSRAAAAVKVLAGRELGLSPIESMRSLHVMDGKVELSADLLAQRVKSHPRYDYRVQAITADRCELEFWEKSDEDDEWVDIGHSIFTIDDAKNAGLRFVTKDGNPTPWTSFPRNMLFARAMSNGVAWFCPDVVGARVYVEGEVMESEEADAYFNPEATAEELAEARETVVAPNGKVVDTATGEIIEGEIVGEGAPEGTPQLLTGQPEPDSPAESSGAVDAVAEPSPTRPPKSAKSATKRQKQTLAILAAQLGWDDERRHTEADVASFNDLDQFTAAHLIGQWQGLAAAGDQSSDNGSESYGEGEPVSEGSTESTAAVSTSAHEGPHEWGPSRTVAWMEICTVAGCMATRDSRSGSFTE